MADDALTDDEIIEPGWLHFPGGGVIEVHSLWHGQVCYAAWAPGAKDAVLNAAMRCRNDPRLLDA